MLNYTYTQAVSLPIGAKQKAFHILGIILQIASFGLLIAGIISSRYFFIGFVLMFSLGVLLYQYYFSLTLEFNYHMTETSIVFSKKDMRLRSKSLLTVPFDRVLSFEIFSDLVENGDYIYLDNCSRSDAKSLVFVAQPQSRVIFAPDDYLAALLYDKLGTDFEVQK